VLIPAFKAAQQRRQAGRIRDFAKVSRSVPDAHSDGIAIPVEAAGIWVASRIELDAALGVDEQSAIRPQVVQNHPFKIIHFASPL